MRLPQFVISTEAKRFKDFVISTGAKRFKHFVISTGAKRSGEIRAVSRVLTQTLLAADVRTRPTGRHFQRSNGALLIPKKHSSPCRTTHYLLIRPPPPPM